MGMSLAEEGKLDLGARKAMFKLEVRKEITDVLVYSFNCLPGTYLWMFTVAVGMGTMSCYRS